MSVARESVGKTRGGGISQFVTTNGTSNAYLLAKLPPDLYSPMNHISRKDWHTFSLLHLGEKWP